jgi:hypothetical protein
VQARERFFVEERSLATKPVRYSILPDTAQRIMALPANEAMTELWRAYHGARLARRAQFIGGPHERSASQ